MERKRGRKPKRRKISTMDATLSLLQTTSNITSDNQEIHEVSNTRKVYQKTVVSIRVKANHGKQRIEVPPADSWSWRKYGQKPIKGSPYPRGYYRCSSSKGCSAKKQVERCRTDASFLIVTYTSSHNHPGPDLPTNPLSDPEDAQIEVDDIVEEQAEEEQQRDIHEPFVTNHEDATDIDHFFHHPPSLSNSSQEISMKLEEEIPFVQKLENACDSPCFVFDDQEPVCRPYLFASSTSTAPKMEESDIYDELEELPIPTFTSISSFFGERIFACPSLM